MRVHLVAKIPGCGLLTAGVAPVVGVGAALAQGCPDVEVVFARGTGEPPGVGPTGQAFVDAVHSRVGATSLEVYPVNYPASNEWDTGVEGIRDAGAHVVAGPTTARTPRWCWGANSQGAAVMGFVTSAAVPDGVDPATVPKPLAPGVAGHVAAVVLFGMPNVRAMNFLGEPPVVIGPTYQDKTLKVCVPEDPVCSDGLNFAAHNTYADDGSMIDQGADFAARRLNRSPGVPAQPPAPLPASGDWSGPDGVNGPG
ncbi:cutinase family protein [Mycobacterium marseillense]|uniref:cutinase family protein n=1 Tax=Mycobacterium marseillense TaxID=701042 RepID=UPI00119D95C2|nr:cutinase family protein [Mycobacterium marseillense]